MYSDNILARKRSVDSSEFTQLKISTPHAGSNSAICTVVDTCTVQYVTFTRACSSVTYVRFFASAQAKIESFESVTQPAGRLARAAAAVRLAGGSRVTHLPAATQSRTPS